MHYSIHEYKQMLLLRLTNGNSFFPLYTVDAFFTKDSHGDAYIFLPYTYTPEGMLFYHESLLPSQVRTIYTHWDVSTKYICGCVLQSCINTRYVFISVHTWKMSLLIVYMQVYQWECFFTASQSVRVYVPTLRVFLGSMLFSQIHQWALFSP